MSEEIIDEIPDALAALTEPAEVNATTEEVDSVVEQVAVDPVVDKASKSGWTDKDAWVAAGKDPDQWVDAGEFVRRGPLIEDRKTLRRKLKEMEDRLDQVAKFATKSQEIGYKKAVADLQAQKREAIQLGDVDAVEAVEKQIDEVRKEFAPDPVDEPQAQAVPEEVQDFAKRNERWFEKDKAMTVYMVETTREYTAAGKPLAEALKLAEADVKTEFAHKFVNPNKERPGAVVANNPEARPKTFGYSSLNAEQRAVYATLKNHMTLDEYIKGLRENGDLK